MEIIPACIIVEPKFPEEVARGEGESWDRRTGTKALFCLAAEIMLAGVKLNIPGVVEALENRLMDGVDDEGSTEIKWTRI